MRAIVHFNHSERMDHWLYCVLAQAERFSSDFGSRAIREPFPSPEAIFWTGAVLFGVWLFAVGASVGSFLNVVVYRVPAGLNLLSPGSRCPRCLHPIRAQHNVPIFGWLALGGRCADCQLPISTRYPLVELLLATIFLVVGSVELIGNGLNLPRVANLNGPPLSTNEPWPMGAAVMLHAGLISTLIAAALIDYDRQPISSRLVTPIIVAAIAVSLVWPAVHPLPALELRAGPRTSWNGFVDVLCGGLAGAGAAFLLYIAAWFRPWLTARYGAPLTLAWIAIGLVFGWQLVPWIFALWSVQLWLSVAPRGPGGEHDLTRQPLLPLRSLAVAVIISLLGWRWIAGYPNILDGTAATQTIIYWLIGVAPAILLSGVARQLPMHYEFPEPISEPSYVPPPEPLSTALDQPDSPSPPLPEESTES